jgi:NAD(P)-dependent dehydrogenase (short-subunit alcohol dehydrogenase family)
VVSRAYAGSVAVVTGSASGIGRATTARLVELGACVIGLDRTGDATPGVDARVVDITDRVGLAAARADVPVVDRLFNCAGVTGAAGAATTLRVNVLGLRDITDVAVGRMPDGGTVTNVASVGGWKWDRNFDLVRAFLAEIGPSDVEAWCDEHPDLVTPSAYPFSKQCVVVETLVRAAQLAPREIRVNAICPGLVDTPMLGTQPVAGPAFVTDFPLPFDRMTTADEQAAVLTHLAGPEAGAVSGAVVPTDQGLLAAVRVGAIPPPFGDA